MISPKLRILLLIMLLQLPLSSWAVASDLNIVYHDFAPFSYEDNRGRAQGILVELTQAVCLQWPGRCNISIRPYRRAMHMFSSGEAKGIFLGWNRERAESMWFSLPLVQTEYGFYTLNDFPITDLSQLAGKVIGVYGPSNTYTSLMRQQEKLKRLSLPPLLTDIYPQGDALPVRMLQKRRFDAYYVNKDVGRFYAGQVGLSQLHYLSAERAILYCVAFNKAFTDSETVRQFNHLFLRLLQEGRLDKIYQKYQMQPIRLPQTDFTPKSMPY
ncbi:substrate-binding periplasmic protein [Shewanella aegiceratis]|uniref:substrate-binding periplasmic protein n=1 Tax=Shewanella aegiceratis TaxID=2864203 RepID=UPI001C65F7A2|nr:transporter substrate-binding domain-containing protein [Shewanella aegiceratis]QYJ82678.1 transporter substrate-binding domain-containing protein [Shewanella aegiceratis]